MTICRPRISCRGVRDADALRSRRDADLQRRPPAVLLRDSVARAHGEPPQPGVPGVGVGVASLPKGVDVEADAILFLESPAEG